MIRSKALNMPVLHNKSWCVFISKLFCVRAEREKTSKLIILDQARCNDLQFRVRDKAASKVNLEMGRQ